MHKIKLACHVKEETPLNGLVFSSRIFCEQINIATKHYVTKRMRFQVGVSKPVLSALEGRDQGQYLFHLQGQKLSSVETPRLIREDKEHHTHFLRFHQACLQSKQNKNASFFHLSIGLDAWFRDQHQEHTFTRGKKEGGGNNHTLRISCRMFAETLTLYNFVNWSRLPLHHPSEHPTFMYYSRPQHLGVPTHPASRRRYPRLWAGKHNCLSYARP